MIFQRKSKSTEQGRVTPSGGSRPAVGHRRTRLAAAAVAAGAVTLSIALTEGASAGTNLTAGTTDVPCGTALATVHPAAGSTVMLQRGCAYSGSLTVNASNVAVTANGTGSNPVITLNRNGATVAVYGSNVTIQNLSLKGIAPSTWTCGGQHTPAGHVDGINLEPGATNNTISNVNATGFYAGVYVMAGSSGNVIKSNIFTDNLQLDNNNSNSSSGAFGVLLWGDSNTVEYNTINNSQACSLAYGSDGSAIEVYGGSNNLISWNNAANDSSFIELGSPSGHIASGNNFSYNTVTDGAHSGTVTFLITRGAADPDGPVYKTVAAHNSVTLTARGDSGAVSYSWKAGDGTLLTLTGNYLNLGKNQALFEDGGYVNGGGNTFIGTCNPRRDCSAK